MADKADARLAKGEGGKLEGAPIGVKDMGCGGELCFNLGARHHVVRPHAGAGRHEAMRARQVAQRAGHFRITSYNVCYTKLLRII